jgi:uncharacterized protein YdaT
VARFKLLAGQYIGADKTQLMNEETGKHPSKTYNAGDKFESDLDLVKIGGYQKFQLLEGRGTKKTLSKSSAPAAVAEEGEETSEPVPVETGFSEEELNAMSTKELKAYAEERGVDVSAAKGKSALVAAILASSPQTSVEEEEEVQDED